MEEAADDGLTVSRDEILAEHPTLLSFIGPLSAEFFHEPTAFDSNDEDYWRTRELDFLLRALRTVSMRSTLECVMMIASAKNFGRRVCSALCILR
jgi:hypothetical protein